MHDVVYNYMFLAVLGWTQETLVGEESSETFTLSLGYLKGSGPDFNVSIVASGTAGRVAKNL